jgi:hypothetical protein
VREPTRSVLLLPQKNQIESDKMAFCKREQARFDVVVAQIRHDLSYSFEGLLMAPARWEDQAMLYDMDKQLVVRAGSDSELLCNYPYQQVALSEFIVAGEDADYPLSETESTVFARAVRTANAKFNGLLEGGEWQPQVARLIVELELKSQATDIDSMRRRILAPLCDVLDATPILPPLLNQMDLDSIDAIDREYCQKMSLFLPAEIQLHKPLEEDKAVELIRKVLPQCPSSIVGSKYGFMDFSPNEHWMSFRTRQF